MLAVMSAKSHHDRHAFAMSSDGIDSIEARKSRASLFLSDKASGVRLIGVQRVCVCVCVCVCVFDLPTGLATTSVDAQVLKLAHIHVDNELM